MLVDKDHKAGAFWVMSAKVELGWSKFKENADEGLEL